MEQASRFSKHERAGQLSDVDLLNFTLTDRFTENLEKQMVRFMLVLYHDQYDEDPLKFLSYRKFEDSMALLYGKVVKDVRFQTLAPSLYAEIVSELKIVHGILREVQNSMELKRKQEKEEAAKAKEAPSPPAKADAP